jgi:anti-anti-sigma factor
MKRHRMRMAVSVCAGSEGDALSSVANQTRTAYDDDRRPQPERELREAGSPPRPLARRMHTLVLEGSLDRGSVRQLEAELEQLCEEGVTGITLDLRGLTHIDAIGVSVVAFRCGLYLRHGYDFALIRGPRAVQRAFEAAGLSELLPFEDAPAETAEPVLALAEPAPAPVPLGEAASALLADAARPAREEESAPPVLGELVSVPGIGEPAPAV